MAIADWLDVMPHTVTIELVTARNDYGKPSAYAAPQSFRARVSYKAQRVTSRVSGTEVVATGSVHLAGVVNNLTIDSRLTLPGAKTPVILDWETVADENGDHHTKIMFYG